MSECLACWGCLLAICPTSIGVSGGDNGKGTKSRWTANRVARFADRSVRSEIQLTAAQTKGDKGRTVLLNAQGQAELSIYLQTLKQPKPTLRVQSRLDQFTLT